VFPSPLAFFIVNLPVSKFEAVIEESYRTPRIYRPRGANNRFKPVAADVALR